MRRFEVPVMVVGAGPVGAMASILLGTAGVPNLVVERRDGPHRAPQAHVVNPRTLEICRALDVDMAAIRKRATPPADGGRVRWVTRLTGDHLGSLPYERQDPDALRQTPTPLANLPQHVFEPILLDRLRKESRSTLRYRHEWSGCDVDDGVVVSCVRDLDDGSEYEVRSSALLACDGAGSRVRKSIGVGMAGPEQLQSFIMIHFEADLRSLVADRPAILYWVMDPETSGVFVAHDIDRTWVFMHPYDPGAEPDSTFSEERCAAIVRRAIGREDVELSIRTISRWTMTAQVAERYREGPIFLVGDAAHRFPPSGGMGMNTGIQDAHNLVWKLRAASPFPRAWAGPALLDTYDTERRPVATENSERSLENAMKMFELLEALGISEDSPESRKRMQAVLRDARSRARVEAAIGAQQDHFDMFALQLGFSYEAGAVIGDGSSKPVGLNPVRDFIPTTRPGSRLPHAWLERGDERLSTLDLISYDRFTLLTGECGAAWVAAVDSIEGVPIAARQIGGDDLRDVDGLWAAVREIEADGALLVRPDGHVAWRVPSVAADPAKALREVLAQLLA